MNDIPEKPKIYHLTHVENLQGIFSSGAVLSDSIRLCQAPAHTNVGISGIKRRRLEELEVSCHPGTKVGEYVPFYFCPRSIMLFLIYRGNHPDLTYRAGQNSIVYFEADLRRVIAWANGEGKRWAFTDANAGARYASFYCSLAHLDKINWEAVSATDFRDPLIKDRKQAEFLLHESFPVDLIETVGAINSSVAAHANQIILNNGHTINVDIKPEWYF
jgi:hypothetical protein